MSDKPQSERVWWTIWSIGTAIATAALVVAIILS